MDTARTRILAAAISAALMESCGTLYAQFIYFFDPDTVFSLVGISVRVALICIVGGVGTVAGPLVARCSSFRWKSCSTTGCPMPRACRSWRSA